MIQLIFWLLTSVFFGFLPTKSFAGSNLLLVGSPRLDGSPSGVASARTVDLGIKAFPGLSLIPRGLAWIATAPKPIESNSVKVSSSVYWQNRFGFVGMTILNEKRFFADGLNEKGLSAALLWLPQTKYASHPSNLVGISIEDIVAYILGQFETAAQAKEALQSLLVWGIERPEFLNKQLPLHLVVEDKYGKSFVAEWTKGLIHIYDRENTKNYQPVLSDGPSYPEQMKKFRKYENLGCVDKKNGMVGLTPLPGNSESSSKFARMAKLVSCVQAVDPVINTHFDSRFLIEDANQALQAAMQVIGRVEVPKGEVVARTANGMKDDNIDYSELTLIRLHGGVSSKFNNDEVSPKIYFRTPENQSFRVIDFSTLDFTYPGKQLNNFMKFVVDGRAYEMAQPAKIEAP